MLHAACLELSELQESTVTLADAAGRRRQEQRANPIKLSGEVMKGLRRNLRLLDPIVEPVLETKAELVKRYSDRGKINLNAETVPDAGGSKLVPNEAREKFLAEFEPLLEKEEEVELYEIAESSFNVGDKSDQNNIPLRILRALGPIVKDEEPKKAA